MPVKYYLAVLCNLFEVSLKQTYVRHRDVVRCSDVAHVTKNCKKKKNICNSVTFITD